MRKASRWLNSLVFSLCLLMMTLPAAGQVATLPVVDARANPEVLLEARVLGLPASAFDQLGLILPESAPLADSPMGFAVILPESEAQALLSDSRTVPVHNLRLQRTAGAAMRFRVDSRVAASANNTGDGSPYFEVSLTFEVTPRAFPSRNIGISSLSMVQIRRGPAPEGKLASVVFEAAPIKHDIQIPEGKTILLGGFLTASNSAGLPSVPTVKGNPVLGYVASKSPRKGDEPEIIVLLTPRLIGAVDVAPPPVTTAVPPAETVPAAKPESPPLALPVLKAGSKPEPEVPAAVAAAPVAAVAAVAPAPPAPKADARFFTVQVGAFGSRTNADALVLELKDKFAGVFVDKAAAGPTPYRVRVGRLSSQAAAKQIQSRLTAQGFDSFVVSPDLP